MVLYFVTIKNAHRMACSINKGLILKIKLLKYKLFGVDLIHGTYIKCQKLVLLLEK